MEKNPYKYRWSNFYSFAEKEKKKKLKNTFITHTMAIKKNKLIETRWKEIFTNRNKRRNKNNNTSLRTAFGRSLAYFHFGTFSLLAKLVQVFFFLLLVLLFYLSFAKGEKTDGQRLL